ncbi:MAG TPA: hypothetical protein VIH16_03655 [Bellilinea sp.]
MPFLDLPANWFENYEIECSQRPAVICQECQGDGYVITDASCTDPVPDIDRCPTCGGSGFVYEEAHAQTKTA